MGFCLIQYLFSEKNFQRKNLFIYVCGCMYVVLKGNGLCILSMMKQLSFLFMLQQFKLLHLLRKFPVMFQAVPVIILSTFPLVLVSYKECGQCLLRITRFFRSIDTRNTLLIQKPQYYPSMNCIQWKWSYASSALLANKIVPQVTQPYK